MKRVVYTSLLHADSSPIGLADEHIATEREIAASGIPYTFFRNGWYNENFIGSIESAVAHGALLGCAGTGKISSAARADYADAAVPKTMAELVAGWDTGTTQGGLFDETRQLSKLIGHPTTPMSELIRFDVPHVTGGRTLSES